MDTCEYGSLKARNIYQFEIKTKCKWNNFYKYVFLFFIVSFFLTGFILCAYYFNFWLIFSNKPTESNETLSTVDFLPKNKDSTVFDEILKTNFITEKETTTEKEITTVTKRYITTKPFLYITPINEKTQVKDIYIDLDFQENCKQKPDKECWNSFTTYDTNNYVVNVQILVSFVMRNCNATETKCTNLSNKKCFQQNCFQKPNFLIFFNQIESFSSITPKNVYFLLSEGNYHSSWQSEELTDFNRKNMKKTQTLIKKINVFKNIPSDQLFLSFTKVKEFECKDCKNPDGNWRNNQTKILPVIVNNDNDESILVYINYSLYSVITLKKDLKGKGVHLHERLHEFMNVNTVSFLTKTIPFNSTLSLKLYNGKNTVSTVLIDSKTKTRLRDIIYYHNKKPTLLIQNFGAGFHLGDWGPESSGSSYYHSNFRIGKYTELVMKDVGFELTNSL